jgi:VIT1/CCC1 family predicted Fe2+/Mn2+ transporter
MGASIGNAISDGAAGFSDGPKAALGVTLGALLPVIPVFIASSVMKAKPTDKKAQYIMMGSSAALVLWAYLKK